jgi:hypothetical protein
MCAKIMKQRCRITDVVQNGTRLRWCKACAKFRGLHAFHTRGARTRQHLCKTHVAAGQRGAPRVRRDAMLFCQRVGVEFALRLEDVRALGVMFDLEAVRPVPFDPNKPLTLENACMVSLAERRTLENFLTRERNLELYAKALECSGLRVSLSSDDHGTEADENACSE